MQMCSPDAVTFSCLVRFILCNNPSALARGQPVTSRLCLCRAERIRSRLQELESEFTPIKARAAPAVAHVRDDEDDDDDEGLSDGDAAETLLLPLCPSTQSVYVFGEKPTQHRAIAPA